MTILEIISGVLLILCSIAIIVMVLFQESKGNGLSGAIAGGEMMGNEGRSRSSTHPPPSRAALRGTTLRRCGREARPSCASACMKDASARSGACSEPSAIPCSPCIATSSAR